MIVKNTSYQKNIINQVTVLISFLQYVSYVHIKEIEIIIKQKQEENIINNILKSIVNNPRELNMKKSGIKRTQIIIKKQIKNGENKIKNMLL